MVWVSGPVKGCARLMLSNRSAMLTHPMLHSFTLFHLSYLVFINAEIMTNSSQPVGVNYSSEAVETWREKKKKKQIPVRGVYKARSK